MFLPSSPLCSGILVFRIHAAALLSEGEQPKILDNRVPWTWVTLPSVALLGTVYPGSQSVRGLGVTLEKLGGGSP